MDYELGVCSQVASHQVGAYKLVVPLLGTCCHWQELEGRELELQGAALISSLSKPCSSCF